jgi:hypothetical protein
MEARKIRPSWQPVEDVNWEAYEEAMKSAKTKQQITLHLRHLIEHKGYANLLRAAEIAFDRLVEVLPGNKGSIGVSAYVDDKEVYCNFRFVPTGSKQGGDEFNY